MKLLCQEEAINQLNQLSKSNRHSVLIEGTQGSGKTYLASYYARILNVNSFLCVDPSVSQLRSTIDSLYGLNDTVCVCIENLDLGVASASYTLLKFLEEPADNVYIVVTCRNMYKVPDTIRSRSSIVSIAPPTSKDVESYMRAKELRSDMIPMKLHQCITTFDDVDTVKKMGANELEYFKSFDRLNFEDPVTQMAWKLMHYPDNSDTPISLVIKYILKSTKNRHVHKCGVSCLDDLSQRRVATHAIVSKFCMDLKYTE